MQAIIALVGHRNFTVGASFEQPAQGVEDIVTLPISKSCAVGSVPAGNPLVHVQKKKVNRRTMTQIWPVPHDVDGRRTEILTALHHSNVDDLDSIVELQEVLSTVEVRADDVIHTNASLAEMVESASGAELGDLNDNLGGQKIQHAVLGYGRPAPG
jgi:hypothetical protein